LMCGCCVVSKVLLYASGKFYYRFVFNASAEPRRDFIAMFDVKNYNDGVRLLGDEKVSFWRKS